MQNAANLELAIGTSTNVVTRAPAIAPSVFSAYACPTVLATDEPDADDWPAQVKPIGMIIPISVAGTRIRIMAASAWRLNNPAHELMPKRNQGDPSMEASVFVP